MGVCVCRCRFSQCSEREKLTPRPLVSTDAATSHSDGVTKTFSGQRRPKVADQHKYSSGIWKCKKTTSQRWDTCRTAIEAAYELAQRHSFAAQSWQCSQHLTATPTARWGGCLGEAEHTAYHNQPFLTTGNRPLQSCADYTGNTQNKFSSSSTHDKVYSCTSDGGVKCASWGRYGLPSPWLSFPFVTNLPN